MVHVSPRPERTLPGVRTILGAREDPRIMTEMLGGWTISSFREFSHLTPAQRRALLASIGPRRVAVAYILRSLFVGFVVGAAFALLFRRSVVAEPLGIGLALVVAVGWYRFELLRLRARIRNEIMYLSRGEQLPACLRCGYDLQDAAERSLCPECGAAVKVPSHWS